MALVALIAYYGGQDIYYHGTGAFDVAIRAAQENGIDGDWQAVPYLSLGHILHSGERTYARIRLFDRGSRLQRKTHVRIMRVADAFWVSEDHPLYIPNDRI